MSEVTPEAAIEAAHQQWPGCAVSIDGKWRETAGISGRRIEESWHLLAITVDGSGFKTLAAPSLPALLAKIQEQKDA